jgi:hypothetical protein
MGLFAVAGCFAAAFAGPPSGSGTTEKILPDFSNVRGLNYIASYAPSDVAMWRDYDHDRVDRELGYVKSLGANSVRVWLAWVVYDAEGEKFIGEFSDFLDLCEAHGITAMPILWDSCFGDAKASYDDVTDWVANPGTERVADPVFREQGDKYVRAVVEAGRGRPGVLIWDVMNEPSGDGINDWLEHYVKLVKEIDPDHPITIGWAAAKSNEVSADWVDVISYHPYGVFDKNRRLWTEAAREVAKNHGDKPILVTEAGTPGWGQRYEECIDFFAAEGIGFYLFEAMIGSDRFRHAAGIVFPDGSVREGEPVRAFRDLARRQAVVAAGGFPVRPGGRTFPKAGGKEVAQMMRTWDRTELTRENYAAREAILRWTLISLAWGGALKDHMEQVTAIRERLEAANAADDLPGMGAAASELAALATKLIAEQGFDKE